MERLVGEYGRHVTASAPGRLDLLNTHQDYKGLPVVPVAVNLRTYVMAVERLQDRFVVESLNLRDEGREYVDEFELKDLCLRPGKHFGNYIRAVVMALQTYLGTTLRHGLRVVINSEVPMGGGLGSSAALEVAFLKLLDHIFGLRLDRYEIAEICYYAERSIYGIPCGRLDQYASAFGGTILLYPKPPLKVEELRLPEADLVAVDSGIKHETLSVHARRQEEINRGLKKLMEDPRVPDHVKALLGYNYDQPFWDSLRLEDVEPYLDTLDEDAAKRIGFTFKMNFYTRLAVKVLRGEQLQDREISLLGVGKGDPLSVLGAVVNIQHELLRDLYEVSTPELERIRDAMLDAGALGVKISGAGMGGVLVAVCEKGKGEEVKKAALSAGAPRGWVVRPDEGARVESLD